MCDSKRYLIAAFIVLLFFAFTTSYAQNGRWVSYDLSTLGAYNSGVGARGDGIVCFAPDGTQYFLIFDVQTGEWLTIDLGAVQDFAEIETRGHIAFAYSDELLVGYSDINAVWDTVFFEGTLLDDQDGFGCSENLAYFITDQYLYVFDSEIGEWAAYAYTMPAGYTTVTAWVKSDYVAIILNRSYPTHPANVVYSFHTKGFNQIDQGTYGISPLMDHGYALYMDAGDHYRLIGYSAYDNNFDVEIYTPVPTEYLIGAYNAGGTPADEYTVIMDAFRYAVSYQYVEANHYAYDTRHGEWVHRFFHLDYGEGVYGGNCHFGGQMASDFVVYDDGNSVSWIIYDGTNGVFRNPSVQQNTQNNWNFRIGGSCFMSWDNNTAWGYDVAGDRGAELDWIEGSNDMIFSGQDFQTITRWSSGSQTMRTYFYNSGNNAWQYIDLPEHHSSDGFGTAHYYMQNGSPENDVIYYSSPLDQIIEHDMPDNENIYMRIRDNLAYASGSSHSVLFNGQSGIAIPFDFNISTRSQNGLGANSAVFCDDGNNILYGYNAISGAITTLNFDEDPYFCVDTGYVGIMTVVYNNNGFNKIYTFNSLADSWVELIPVGAHRSILVGKRTALISRDQNGMNPDYIYAFDPQREITDIDRGGNLENRDLPDGFEIQGIYPNPFNAQTRIKFSLSRSADIKLTVYNILGQKTAVLFDGRKPAGEQFVTWNAEGLPSGVYFARLEGGEAWKTAKMLLLK